MATIQVQDRGSFVFFRWEGLMNAEEISAVAAEYYPRLGDRNKLYDMTHADLSALTSENLTAVARTVASVQTSGSFSKTAFVTGEMKSYSILSRYLLHVFHNRVPVEYRIFTDATEAEEWLGKK